MRIEHVGSWGGSVNCFAREGNIGVVGSGERLVVLDMADPMHFVELGAVRLGSPVMDVALQDGFAHVMTTGIDWSAPKNHLGRRGPHVVDVRDPAHPALVWSKEPDDGYLEWHRVGLYSNANGSLAIIKPEHPSSLGALEISDPMHPVALTGDSVWRWAKGNGSFTTPREFAIQGDVMYTFTTMAGAGRLLTYDLSTIDPHALPMTPPLLGYLDFGSQQEIWHVAVEGDRLYLVVEDDQTSSRHIVYAIDVADPATPAIVGEYDLPYHSNSPPGLAVSGGLVYLTDPPRDPDLYSLDHSRGLIVLDMLSDPANPAVLGEHRGRTGAFSGLHVEGSTVYLFDRGEGLVSFDATDPANPVRLGGYYSPAALRQIEKQGDLLFVSDCWKGFTILDVSDPTSPRVVGTHQALGIDNWGLDVKEDGLVYIATGHWGLEVVDVSEPAAPELVGAVREPPYGEFYHDQEGIYGVSVVDDVAYVGSQVGGPGWTSWRLFSFDVTNPASIVPLDPDGEVVDYFMVALSFEHDPQRELLFATGEPGARGLAVVDIADPAELEADDDLGVPFSYRLVASSLDADRNLLAVVDGTSESLTGGLSLLDVTDPHAPAVLSHTPMGSPGATTTHALGTIVVGEAPDLTGCRAKAVLLLDTRDPSSPRPLGAAYIAGVHASDGSAPFADVLADGQEIYVSLAYRESPGGVMGRENLGLTIFSIEGGEVRSADRNEDGRIDSRDLAMLLRDLRAGRASADLNGDGHADAMDVMEWLEAFQHGGSR